MSIHLNHGGAKAHGGNVRDAQPLGTPGRMIIAQDDEDRFYRLYVEQLGLGYVPVSRNIREYYVSEYGAKGDGVTDDTVAIQAAITAAITAGGGRVIFDNLTYVCSAALNCDHAKSLTLEVVAGGPKTLNDYATVNLKFTHAGSTTANCIQARSSYGFTLRNMRIATFNVGFGGTVVNLDNDGAGDTGYALIDRCQIQSGVEPTYPQYGISLDGAIISTIRCCLIGAIEEAGIIGRRSGASYSNAIQIEDNAFQAGHGYAIKNGGEAWLIQGNTFEPTTNSSAYGYFEDLASGGPITFVENWFGDAASFSTKPWIHFMGFCLTCRDNAFFKAGTKPAIELAPDINGVDNVLIEGNRLFMEGYSPVVKALAGGEVRRVTFIGNRLEVDSELYEDSANPIKQVVIINTFVGLSDPTTYFAYREVGSGVNAVGGPSMLIEARGTNDDRATFRAKKRNQAGTQWHEGHFRVNRDGEIELGLGVGGAAVATVGKITSPATGGRWNPGREILAKSHSHVEQTITYSASMTIDCALGDIAKITLTNGTAFTINNPTNPVDGQELHIRIRNNSGGAAGAITFGAKFKYGTTLSMPANGQQRVMSFYYNASDDLWFEMFRNTDIPL